MTDTYIWQKLRQRFLAIEGTITYRKYNSQTGEWEEYDTDIIIKNDEGDITNVIAPNVVNDRDELGSKNNIWFEIFPLHSQPYQQELGTAGRNRWNFGLQININTPKDFGTYDVDTVYDAIAAQFKRGDIFDGIRVLQTAYRSSARLHDDYYSVPVTVMVQADLEN